MDKISNELYISIIVSMIGVIIGGITFNYPILTSKHNRNDPDYGWKYILRECQPIFLLTYEKYGWIGSIHQVWYDWFPWFFSFIYITLILFKMWLLMAYYQGFGYIFFVELNSSKRSYSTVQILQT